MKEIHSDERGFVSVTAAFCLSMLLFFGGAIYSLNEVNTKVTERFLNGKTVRLAAEDGARAAMSKIKADVSLQNQIENAPSEQKILSANTDDAVSIEAYAVYRSGKIVILSVASKGDTSARSVLYLKKKETDYVIDRWEH